MQWLQLLHSPSCVLIHGDLLSGRVPEPPVVVSCRFPLVRVGLEMDCFIRLWLCTGVNVSAAAVKLRLIAV